MKLGPIVSFTAALVACSILATPAFAQATDEEVAAGVTYLTSTSTSGLTTTVGGIILTVVLVNSGKKKALKWYIRDNAVALKQDVTMGGGATVADVAHLFGAPPEHLETFARALRSRRQQLVALVGTTPIDDERTEEFMETVWEAVADDEALADAVATSFVQGG